MRWENFLSSFQKAAVAFPERPALVYKNRRYTYAGLDDLTDRLAAYLKKEGIGRGSVVSVLVPRSEYMIISALGILKTGAAYEPLDASHPKNRICAMIETADASLIIVPRAEEDLISEDFGNRRRKMLYLEDIEGLPPAKVPLPVVSEPEDVFVVLFTSGSTGEPKGIMLTHRNISVLLSWYLSCYEVDENCRMGEHPSFVFDLAILESLLPLAAGACVFVIPEEIRTDLLELGRFFEENGITHVTMTTRLGRIFARNISCASLKHLTVGGEALINVGPPDGYTLHNGYGPAECTAFVTMFPVQKTYPGKVPLGHAMPDVELYITDSAGKMVKDGRIGELCISGPHVAKGYINRPDLTEKAFTKNPFSKDPAYSILYHTGDLVRIDEDGLYEFMGRADRQIKVRGFRIEPSEIEILLEGFCGIRAAVVSTVGTGENKALCAWYQSNEPVDQELLAGHILAARPSYMLPSFFVHMKQLPLNVNGKIDFSKLPAPFVPEGISGGEVQKDLKTPVEERLAALFEEVLPGAAAGREDSFFRLGGDSLSAAALAYRIYELFSVRLKFSDIMDHPVLSELAEHIDRLAASSVKPETLLSVLPAAPDYPVSRQQERIYTAQQLLSDTDPVYLIRLRLKAEAGFDRERVISVLKCLFERHESLRASFYLTGEGLRQRIAPAGEAALEEAVDRSECEELFPPGLRLDRAPLFSWHYCAKTLCFAWHHIISDGRSAVLFAEEFVRLYNGGSLPGHGLHQKEYAAFEQRLRGAGDGGYKRMRDWWRALSSRFTGAEETRFPPDGTFRNGEVRHAGHFRLIFPGELSEMIDAFCIRQQITPYIFLLTVFSIMTARYAKQEELILGTVTDGRFDGLNMDMQGMFVNTLPLYLRVSEKEPFSELLEQVRKTVLSAIENQSLPLEEIASDFSRAGGFERTSHGQLLFDVLFVMQSHSPALPEIGGKKVSLCFEPSERAMYDLTLETEKTGGLYHCDFEYDFALFSSESVRYMARHFENLARACLRSEASKPVGALSMIDETERALLLRDFQAEARPGGFDGATVVDLLLARAEETPDQTAVVFQDASLTYAQLCERAGDLALRIRRVVSAGGSGMDQRVAIVAERGLSMIVSIWGVLFSGCSYVPVSPRYPTRRLLYVLKDCEPSIVISCECRLPEEAGQLLAARRIPVLSADPEPDGKGGDGRVDGRALTKIRPSGDRAAYMIYTSGSTGEPKGVVVEHRQLSAMLQAYGGLYRLNREDVVLQLADFVFDQSVWEIFQILTTGGTLCLIPDALVKDPDALASCCRENRVSVVSMTPGYLRLLDPRDFPTLRLLEVGGEAPDRRLLIDWTGGRELYNTYGPTETTVNATSFLFSRDGSISPDPLREKTSVPIGKPCPGTQVYVLDDQGLCGIGVPGELCIGGLQVARGYFHRPELTALKFTENPCVPGRMYRSGDMARFLPDGNLEFLGRFDDQVKLRGFRIEPGEIESVVRSLPGVKDAAVVIRKGASGDDILCCYYVDTEPGSIPVSRRRDALEERLPGYMVPGYLAVLPRLPVTLSGKIDRGALPEPEADMVSAESPDPLEKELGETFSEVLGLPAVGADADFLALGGDSIKAIRIASMLRQKGIRIDANAILQYRAIRKIVPRVEKAENREYTEYIVVRKTPVMRLFERAAMACPSWYNQSVLLLLDSKGFLTEERLETELSRLREALSLLVLSHGMLRMQITAPAEDFGDGTIRIRPSSGYDGPELPVYHELTEQERAEKCTVQSRAVSPLRGEPLKAALFVNGGQLRLFLTIHHYAIDEVSWKILLEDLGLILRIMHSGGETAPADHAAASPGILKELRKRGTASFGEWAEKLWRFRDSEDFLPERIYWERLQKRLTGNGRDTRSWIECYTGSPKKTGFSRIRRLLSAKWAKEIPALSKKRYGAKPDAVLLTCLLSCVREDGAPEETVILMEGHGRGRICENMDVTHTIGWFTTVYPLAIRMDGSFDEQVLSVKESLLKTPQSGLGYGLIYENPYALSGLVFNYLGENSSESFEGFRLTDEDVGEEISPDNGDPGTISMNLRFTGAGLSVECCYDSCFSDAKIRGLFDRFLAKLEGTGVRIAAGERICSPSDLCRGQAMELTDWRVLTSLFSPEKLDGVCRLTPLQQGMFYRYITERESRIYYLQDRLCIRGKWKQESFQTALRLVSLRYDALRLRFACQGLEEPWQLILKDQVPEYREEPELSVEEAAVLERARGISLLHGPIVRFTRCRGTEDETALLITTHHCILDGWSFQILVQELMTLYRGLLEGRTEEELRTAVQRDVSHSPSFMDVLEELSRKNHEKSLRRWEHYLRGVTEGCAPGSFRLKKQKITKHEKAAMRLNRTLTERIRAYTRKHHITAASFFGVLWGIQLGFETDRTDVVFGETVSGRNMHFSGIEDTVGMLIRTIPVRIRFEEEKRILSLMKKRQEDYFSMQPFEDSSISDIGSRTGLSASLIKTLYIYENYPLAEEPQSYRLEPVFEEWEYDLSLNVEGRGRFVLTLAFDSSEYTSSYMNLLLARLAHLCDRVTVEEEITTDELERISPSERQTLLQDFAGVRKPCPKKTFPDLFFAQAVAAPEREALILEDRSLSYGALWEAASRLAARLGFGEERFIAIMADRSFELVISVIGILLAGAAYLPLDPDFPTERLEYILADSRPQAVLCCLKEKNEKAETLFEKLGIPVIHLSDDPDCGEVPRNSGETELLPPPATELLWERIAYMLYTSGSTGNPKGVEVEHKTLSGMISSHADVYGSFRNDIVLLLTNYVFDMSIEQMLIPLAEGGRVCIMPKEMMESPLLMEEYCQKNRITFLGGTNAFLRVFHPESFRGIRVVSFCGDEADPVLFRQFQQSASMVVNDYGPTEACVHATAHIFDPEEEESVPIGRPYNNRKIYILQGTKLCGVGQLGEICIAGGLARGYHNREELTEKAFVDNPFGEGRIYRTGDQGVFRPDGSIAYRGRKDSQIKLRGFRIELSEPESCLRTCEGVTEALVLCRKENGREPYLCAYVTGSGELDPVRLRQHMGQHLPGYMIPECFVRLDRFPLNINGKIDRKQLPVPEGRYSGEPGLPENVFEERVASLFRKILSLERVGMRDSFFELGGNSIDLMKLLSELNEEGLSRTDILEHPDPRSLGRLMNRRCREKLTRTSFSEDLPDDAQGCILLRKGDGSQPSLFLIPPSGGMTLCYAGLIRELTQSGSIYGLTDGKYKRFAKMTLEDLKAFDPWAEDLWPETINGYWKTLQVHFRKGDILIGYSQGAHAAHILAGMLEEAGLTVSRLIILESVPLRESSVDARLVTKAEGLHTVGEIFFGSGERTEKEAEAAEPTKAAEPAEPDEEQFFIESLKAHGEQVSGTLLHPCYEVWLVYCANMAFPLTVGKRIKAPICSVILTKEVPGGPDGSRPVRLTSDPWEELTENPGEAYGIFGDETGHMTFLDRCRKSLASLVKRWISVDV